MFFSDFLLYHWVFFFQCILHHCQPLLFLGEQVFKRTTTIFVCLKLIYSCLKFVAPNDTGGTSQVPNTTMHGITSNLFCNWHFNHQRYPYTYFHILALLCLSLASIKPSTTLYNHICLYYCCSRISV